MRKVTTAIILDTRKKRKTGLFPVTLRVTYMRKQKYYVMGYHYTPEEFEKVIGPKPRNKYKEAKMKLLKMEEKAIRVIESLPEFSFYAFEEAFFKKSTSSNLVFDAFEKTIIRLKGEGRVGTADSYKCSYNSLKKFTNRKSLTFEEVTPDFLKSYEGWMIQHDKSVTTVGIYLRCMKALFNEAIQLGAVQPELYPFGRRKYQIPAGRNVKKALSLAEIEKIVCYAFLPYSSEDWAKDLWAFSYLCNGINIKDIARLKYQNIDGDQVVFVRAKTKLTSRQQQKPVVAYLTPEAKNIIEKWGNKPAMPTKYVFPILTADMDPEKELATTRQTINPHYSSG